MLGRAAIEQQPSLRDPGLTRLIQSRLDDPALPRVGFAPSYALIDTIPLCVRIFQVSADDVVEHVRPIGSSTAAAAATTAAAGASGTAPAGPTSGAASVLSPLPMVTPAADVAPTPGLSASMRLPPRPPPAPPPAPDVLPLQFGTGGEYPPGLDQPTPELRMRRRGSLSAKATPRSASGSSVRGRVTTIPEGFM